MMEWGVVDIRRKIMVFTGLPVTALMMASAVPVGGG